MVDDNQPAAGILIQQDDMAPVNEFPEAVDGDSIQANSNVDFEDDSPLPPTAIEAPVEQAVVADASPEHDMNIGQQMEDGDSDEEDDRIKFQINEPTFSERRTLPGAQPLSLPTLNSEEVGVLLAINHQVMNQLTQEQLQSLAVHGSGVDVAALSPLDRFFDKARKLVQEMESGGIKFVQTLPPRKDTPKGTLLDMAEASAYAASLRKAYDTIYLPALHSGMWLKVTVPRGDEIHVLMRQMLENRARLGYASRGMTYSTDGALRNMAFVNFLIERTVATNMVDSSPKSIRRNLTTMDIQPLARAMASAMWPSGYPVDRACSTKPGVCTHVAHDTLRISKMEFVDEDMFTDKQRAHMQTLLKRAHQKTDADMAAYRAEFGQNIVRVKPLADGISITYEIPSIEMYEDASEEWATEIMQRNEQLLETLTEDAGQRHVHEQANLAVMTKYSPWVTEINMHGRLVQDRRAIRAVLASWSDVDEYVTKFQEDVTNYIEECTAVAVGVEDYRCPVCNGLQATGKTNLLKAIVPIDAVELFFILAQRKIQQKLYLGTAR